VTDKVDLTHRTAFGGHVAVNRRSVFRKSEAIKRPENLLSADSAELSWRILIVNLFVATDQTQFHNADGAASRAPLNVQNPAAGWIVKRMAAYLMDPF
jgi:hypothetical protein